MIIRYRMILMTLLCGWITGIPAYSFGSTENDSIWTTYQQALESSRQDDKPIILFVEAEWCIHCRNMKSESFSKDEIKEKIRENYHLVSLDLDSRKTLTYHNQEMTQRELAQKLNVQTTPTTFFIDSNEKVMGSREGYMNTETIEYLLSFVVSEWFGEISFEEFKEMN